MTDGTAQHRASVAPPLSNRGYDFFKQFVTVIFPGLITFYLAVAGSWDLSYTEPIVGTATALGVLLGLLLKSLSTKYAALEQEKKEEEARNFQYDGDIHFVKFEGQDANLLLSVSTQEQVESFANRDELTFKVRVG